MKTASDGPPKRAMLRGLSALGLVIVLALLLVTVATANPGVINDFSQWANKDMKWVFGNLNAGNSAYHESEAVPQRILYDATCGTTEELTIRYQTTKAGKHAFDYLATYNHTAALGMDQTKLCMDYPAACTGWVSMQFPIPDDPNTSFDGGQLLTAFNGTITSITGPAIFAGTYAGDSETQIVVRFTPTCTAGQTTAPVLLAFAAHVASQADYCPPNGGCGAFNISGSPYHVMTINGGSRDNSMQAGVVVTQLPQIVVCKRLIGTDENPPHQFQFTFDPPGTTEDQDFSLVNGECKRFSGFTSRGQISIFEHQGTSPFIFRRVECEFGPNTTRTDIPFGVRLNVTDLSQVQCTFVNAQATAVKLAGFNGQAAGRQVQLDWQTGTETNNAGFNVLRAKSAAGPWERVNPQLIGATGDATVGGTYKFTDRPGSYGAFFYKLENVDLSGQVTEHGPVQVTVVFPYRRLPHQPAPPAQ